MVKIRNNSFAAAGIIILVAVFLINLFLSRDYNLFMIMLTGGGRMINSLGASHACVFEDLQLHRLITYGYLHPTVWHLAANVLALWYTCLYLEKVLSRISIALIYHLALIISCTVFLLIFHDGYMYGASPAIFCFLGMMAAWLIKDRALLDDYKGIEGNRYLFCYMILSNFLSLGTFVVHLAGFCLGLLVGFVVKRKKWSISP